MKKYSKSLVFGKFLPFHDGHRHLVETAIEHSDIVELLVCTIKSEPIPGYIRYDWVKRIFKKEEKSGKLVIKHITDELPQYPKNEFDTDFWYMWTHLFDRELGDFDAVFTSEKYGDDVVYWMKKMLNKDIKHFCVDYDRQIVPVSGTKIRENPLEYWKFIPKVERPYFIKKVCIVGPESVGKTVMTRKLSNYYKCPPVYEYGREYCEKLGNPTNLTPIDFSNIASRQLLMEEESSYESENGLLICDTDTIITEIFSYMYYGGCPEWIRKVNRAQKYDLYLLLTDEVPYVQDGTRLFEKERNDHFHVIRREIHKRGLNYKMISGNDYDNRIEQAKKHIDYLIQPNHIVR